MRCFACLVLLLIASLPEVAAQPIWPRDTASADEVPPYYQIALGSVTGVVVGGGLGLLVGQIEWETQGGGGAASDEVRVSAALLGAFVGGVVGATAAGKVAPEVGASGGSIGGVLGGVAGFTVVGLIMDGEVVTMSYAGYALGVALGAALGVSLLHPARGAEAVLTGRSGNWRLGVPAVVPTYEAGRWGVRVPVVRARW